MSDFKKRLNTLRDLFEENPLIEMANLGPSDHRLEVDVKINLLQPGKRVAGHAPRIKVYKKDPKINFSIVLDDDVKKIVVAKNGGDPRDVVRSVSDLNKIVKNVKKYRKAFLKFWFDSGMTISELKDLMNQIDAGKEI